jgi:hypothetical protein
MYFIYLGSRPEEYLLEQLIFAKLVMKCPHVWNKKFTAVFTTAHRVVLITWQIPWTSRGREQALESGKESYTLRAS